MPDPNITATQVSDVVVTARRASGGNVEFFIKYKTLSAARYSVESRGEISRARFLENVSIQITDETGTLPNIEFESAIPAETLQALIDVLALYSNQSALTPSDTTQLNDLFGVFDQARQAGVGIRFAVGFLPTADALMGAVLNSETLQPAISNGFMTIRVARVMLSNPRALSDSARSVLYHEILHLNRDYNDRALARFNRGRGNRPFNETRFNEFHQTAFWNRAEVLNRIIKRGIRNLPPPSTIVGNGTGQDLVGQSLENEIFSINGNNSLTGYGLCDFLFGGPGNDRYIFTQASQAYQIYDDGGDNTLVVEGPYTKDHLRIGNMRNHLLVAIAPSASSAETAYDMNRVVMIPIGTNGIPVVQTVEVGGIAYALPDLTRLQNSRPEIIGPTTFDIPMGQGTSGLIGYIVATDRDGDPITYSITSVAGLGETSSWWIDNTALKTSFRNSNQAGRTAVTVKVSDGRAEDEREFIITWRGNIRP